MLKPEGRKSARAALLLLRTALAHYDVIEPLFFADVRYTQDESFSDSRVLQDAMIQKQFSFAPKAKRGAQ